MHFNYSWPPRLRTWKLRGQNPAGLPIPPAAIRASHRSRTGTLPLTGRLRYRLRQGGGAGTRRGAVIARPDRRVPSVLGAIRTHTAALLRRVPPAVGLRGLEPSSGADPDHAPYGGAVTAVCDGVAAGQRLELRFTAPEAAVLPLDDPASGGACPPRDSNPD
jgi:hypothetical protein